MSGKEILVDTNIFLYLLKGNDTLAEMLEGKNIYSEKLSSEGLIVIGNESRGISEEVQKLITDKISIPSFSHYKSGGGEAESLNAAIATSIICSEFRRR